ncbi:MAG: (2Fe-2S)-binding protein, partial [Natronospirillum sp.]
WYPAAQGFCWLPAAVPMPDWSAWVRRDMSGGVVYQYALDQPRDLHAWVAEQWPGADVQMFRDEALGLTRLAVFEGERLRAAIWQEPDLPDVTPGWLAARMGEQTLKPEDRRDLLAGRSSGLKDPGPLVCSCHQVGTVPIMDAITREGCTTVNALGKALKCGTQCGSCIPELQALLRRHGKEAA